MSANQVVLALIRPILPVCLIAIVLAVPQPTQCRVITFDSSVPNNLTDRPIRTRLLESFSDDQDERPAGGKGPTDAGKSHTPVLFWHGMGDYANGSINVDRLALLERFPDIKVFSVQIGDTIMEDEMSSYFSNVNQQIKQVCEQLLRNEDIRRAKAINAIGFSQGGQFLRGLVQRCPLRSHGIRVKNLITLGGQHQGVYGLPKCSPKMLCDYIRHMLNSGAYLDYVQQHLVQAEYWHDPLNEALYKARNIFLPDINNELSINETYRANLLALDNLVLVKFLQDEMVVPRESSLFGFYEPGNNEYVRDLMDTPLYREDRLGLKQLHESGRLKMISVPGRHLQYKMAWFLEEIAAKYLDN